MTEQHINHNWPTRERLHRLARRESLKATAHYGQYVVTRDVEVWQGSESQAHRKAADYHTWRADAFLRSAHSLMPR